MITVYDLFFIENINWTYAKSQASTSPLLVIFDFGIIDVYLFYSIEGFFFSMEEDSPKYYVCLYFS